jgi:ABC-type iron transport system FetAB ATPase subunit
MCNIEKLEDKYFLLNFDHTFLAASLQEEALLFGVNHHSQLLQESVQKFQAFKPDFTLLHPIDHLSGGENAILAVIFYSALALHKHKNLNFLLHNILESLSPANRTALKAILAEYQRQGISYNLLQNNEVVPVSV